MSDRPAESEKITINLGHVDLGRIDLMVQEGFYSNRTDFIRTAIRNQLSAQGDALANSLERHSLELGLREIGRAELEAARGAGEMLHIRVVGLARIADDVSADLAKGDNRIYQGPRRSAGLAGDPGSFEGQDPLTPGFFTRQQDRQ